MIPLVTHLAELEQDRRIEALALHMPLERALDICTLNEAGKENLNSLYLFDIEIFAAYLRRRWFWDSGTSITYDENTDTHFLELKK